MGLRPDFAGDVAGEWGDGDFKWACRERDLLLFNYSAVVRVPPFDVVGAGREVANRNCSVFDFGRLVFFDYYAGPGGLGIEEP